MSTPCDPSEEKPALDWLCMRFPESPRKRVKEWFAKGKVKLDGETLTKGHITMSDPGERLGMGEAAPPVFFRHMPMRIHAQLNLLYIDSSLAIVNKGPGLLSISLPESNQPSAMSLLDGFLQGKGAEELDRQKVNRKRLTALPVHRIDQYTSGLLCFAMNEKAREDLIRQVKDHTFLREYLALGDGKLDVKKGEWKSWFRLDEHGLTQTVFDQETEGATLATSTYEVVDEISWPTSVKGEQHTVSRLRLRLDSGLKHQLRIHAAKAGVPLLGDRRYHPDFKKAAEDGRNMPYGCKRQALHASSLGFIHPVTGKMRHFNCKFARDLADIEDELRRKA
jgi:23S rRNA pseudouridine1911/1915/1917 synthase